jgi:hypothetical protein
MHGRRHSFGMRGASFSNEHLSATRCFSREQRGRAYLHYERLLIALSSFAGYALSFAPLQTTYLTTNP